MDSTSATQTDMAETAKFDRQEALEELKRDFGGFWSLNWERRMALLQQIQPTPSEVSDLANLLMKYINTAMECGTFGNLEGIQPVMEYLGLESLVFTPEWTHELDDLMKRFSVTFLYSLWPTTWDGKLRNGEKFERIPYTIEKLKGHKAVLPGEDVSVLAEKIWKLREVMVKLHYMQNRGLVKNVGEIAGVKCLELLTRQID